MCLSKWPEIYRSWFHVRHHAVHLDFLKDSILFEEYFNTHRSKIHKEAAGAEPEDLFRKVAYDCIK